MEEKGEEYLQRRDRKSPIVIIISTIYPPLADKSSEKHSRARLHASTGRREGETRRGEAETTGAVSREIQKVLDGPGVGYP